MALPIRIHRKPSNQAWALRPPASAAGPVLIAAMTAREATRLATQRDPDLDPGPDPEPEAPVAA